MRTYKKKKPAVIWIYICRREKEDDIRKVHEMKVTGKRNQVQTSFFIEEVIRAGLG